MTVTESSLKATRQPLLESRYGGPPMSPTEVARWLGTSDKRVREMCAGNEFPKDLVIVTQGPKGQNRWQIYPKAVEAWIRTHRAA